MLEKPWKDKGKNANEGKATCKSGRNRIGVVACSCGGSEAISHLLPLAAVEYNNLAGSSLNIFFQSGQLAQVLDDIGGVLQGVSNETQRLSHINNIPQHCEHPKSPTGGKHHHPLPHQAQPGAAACPRDQTTTAQPACRSASRRRQDKSRHTPSPRWL